MINMGGTATRVDPAEPLVAKSLSLYVSAVFTGDKATASEAANKTDCSCLTLLTSERIWHVKEETDDTIDNVDRPSSCECHSTV